MNSKHAMHRKEVEERYATKNYIVDWDLMAAYYTPKIGEEVDFHECVGERYSHSVSATEFRDGKLWICFRWNNNTGHGVVNNWHPSSMYSKDGRGDRFWVGLGKDQYERELRDTRIQLARVKKKLGEKA